MDMRIDTSVFDSREFALFRQGVRRVKGQAPPRTALPITLPVLCRINHVILADVTLSAPDRLMLAAAYALSFACFLRVGEIAYDKFDPLLHLQRQDVLFTPQGMAIRLKGSKMDPSRRGVILPLPRINDASYKHVCPSNLLRLMLTSYVALPDAPLFNFRSMGPAKFDAKRLVRQCRHALVTCGFSISDWDGRVFSGHSFRRGAATWAARVGLEDRSIMRLGRWSVKAMPGGHQRYVEFTLQDHRDLVSSLYDPASSRAPRDVGFDLGEGDVNGEEYEDDGLPPH